MDHDIKQSINDIYAFYIKYKFKQGKDGGAQKLITVIPASYSWPFVNTFFNIYFFDYST